MKINCDQCGKKLNIPDEKIPPGKKISISCPACKNKISLGKTLEIEAVEVSSGNSANEDSSGTQMKNIGEQLEAIDPSQFIDEGLEVLDEDAKRALICDTANEDEINAALKEMGYLVKTVASPSEAIGRLKFTQYDLVVLADDFADSSFYNNLVLKYIQPMPMSTRRKIFVALLGKDFRTMDNMKAFTSSVNVVINLKDIGNLSAILKKTISENNAFYKVFNETLISIG